MSTTPTTTNALVGLTPQVIQESMRTSPELLNYLAAAPGKLTIAKQVYQKIETEEQAQALNDLLNWFKAGKDCVEKNCDPTCKYLNGLHKASTDFRAAMLKAFVDGINFLDGNLKAFLRAQMAERERAQKEQDRAAEKQRREMEQAALALTQLGRVQEAEAIEQQAQTVMAPAMPPALPELAGTSYRGKYVAKVDDLIKLLKAIVDGKVDVVQPYRGEMRPLVIIDDSILQSLAKQHGKMLAWPGVSVKEDIGLARKGR